VDVSSILVSNPSRSSAHQQWEPGSVGNVLVNLIIGIYRVARSKRILEARGYQRGPVLCKALTRSLDDVG